MCDIPADWKKVVDDRMKDPDDMGKYTQIALLYTGSANVYLNKFLREQEVLKTDAERDAHISKFQYPQDKIWELYNSLIDLRVKPPSIVTLYRGLPANFVSHLKVGDIYHDPGFMSFSFSISAATNFSRSGAIIVFKNPEEGVWFGTMSAYKNEFEFVIGPRCKFFVNSIEERIIGRITYKFYDMTFIGYNHYGEELVA
jgi:hypothetical protein